MLLPIWALAFMKYRFPVALALLLGGIALTFVIGAEWSWLFWLPRFATHARTSFYRHLGNRFANPANGRFRRRRENAEHDYQSELVD